MENILLHNFHEVSLTMNKGNYRAIELGALVFISFALSLFSSFEYSIYEEKSMPSFYGDIDLMLTWGAFSFLFSLFYYYLFLKKLVLKNYHWFVFLSLPFVIMLSNYYDKYIRDFLVIQLTFLPESVIKYHKNAYYNYYTFKTAFSYKLSHQFLALVGVAYWVRSLQQSDTIKTLKEQQLLTELKYLKDRLHPHFFFNTLNNIYALSVENSPKAPEMIAGLASLMRYMLYESDKEWVPLRREVEIMQQYVELEKIRYGNRFKIDFDSQGITEKDRIPPLLFLPFIENAFKHGLENEMGAGFVSVIFLKIEERLIFEVKNSIPANRMKREEGGLGLSTAEKRWALLFKDDYEITVKQIGLYEVQIALNRMI